METPVPQLITAQPGGKPAPPRQGYQYAEANSNGRCLTLDWPISWGKLEHALNTSCLDRGHTDGGGSLNAGKSLGNGVLTS